MRRFNRLAAAGAATLALTPSYASAQFGDGLTQTAIAVQAYEKSVERCAYEPIVGQALDRLRDHYAETEPYRWQRPLRESRDGDDILGNMAALALQGSPYTADPTVSGSTKPPAPRDARCVGSGLAVGAALPFAATLIGFDQTLFAEANRLMEGKGRMLAVADPAPAAQPDASRPGAAAPEGQGTPPGPALVMNVRSPFRGATFVDVSPATARQFGIDVGTYGAVKASCQADGFAMCGIFQRGDVVVEVDGAPVRSIQDLGRVANRVSPRWTVTFIRGGERVTSTFPG
ncbi:PDZ domain-containing protein [Methylobacterium sp. E-005]|uniref:PDZ domain-containing protein n=1 Tax=Methylobacterium sp. E-005 TaxID=2836549 RepID=UPI001FBBA288|nr:PDZ domain-containing protein [Methylobacterium sp. E-005]MCJ2087629.1 PDZ domain-containing protein [Methylobacterium sp. E-005]